MYGLILLAVGLRTMGNKMPKLTHLLLLVFVIFAAHNANALNLTEGPPIPREFALAEKSDPYGRIASSYIVPDRWTNIVSPLNELKVSDGWALTDFDTIKFIVASNIKEDFGSNGYAKANEKECRQILIDNPKEHFQGGSTKDRSKPNLNACLHRLRTLVHRGDLAPVAEVLEAWSGINLTQPRTFHGDYDWYRIINFAASIFALVKDEIEFEQKVKNWLKDSLNSTQLRTFGKNNTYYPRGIVAHPDVFTNDCSTTRFMYTQAYLLGGLALNDQDIFDEGIDSLQYILAGFDEENVYICYGMRGIRVTTYHNKIPSFLSAYQLILSTVGYDFFEHLMPNGHFVHEAARTTFKYAWDDDIGPLLKYAHVNNGVAGVLNWEDLKKPLIERNPRYQTPAPATVIRSSLVYVDRYQPELKKLFGYELFYSSSVSATKFPDGYLKKDLGYGAYQGDQPLDLNAIYRANSYNSTIRNVNFTNAYLDPPFHPEVTNYAINYTLDTGQIDLNMKLRDPQANAIETDSGFSLLKKRPIDEILTSKGSLDVLIRSHDGKERVYKFVGNKLSPLGRRYECKFKLRRLNNGQTDADLASGQVRIVKGKPLFRNVSWKSGDGRVPENHLSLSSSLVVTEEGTLFGFAPVFTNHEDDFVELFNFAGQFEKDGSLIPEGFHKSFTKDRSNGISVELDIYACYLVPDVVVEKPQPSDQTAEEKFAFKPVIVDFTPLSIEFYGLFENDEFMNFKGEIKDSEGQQFGDGKLNIGLMFDFRNLKKKQKNIVRDYKISVNVDGLDGVTNIEDIRSCEKAFWEDDGQIKQVYIRMKYLEENRCVFEKLPEETVAILQRLATNMAEILERATFEDQSWNERVITLSSKFH